MLESGENNSPGTVMARVSGLWVRLDCSRDPGPSRSRPRRDRLGCPGYHLPPDVSPKVTFAYLVGKQRPT